MQSSFAESYRTLRTNIQFSFMDKELGSLMVTSAGEQEGKSTTVLNLSYTMAMTGKTVLMIEALRTVFNFHGGSFVLQKLPESKLGPPSFNPADLQRPYTIG
jgi:hypothetical protein